MNQDKANIFFRMNERVLEGLVIVKGGIVKRGKLQSDVKGIESC